MSKRYNTLNEELTKQFGAKVMKLSVDGGFTCPNRDGKIGSRGCIFCGEEGAGEFTANRFKSIKDQAKDQIELLSRKWKTDKYIIYFQNFTNTYGDINKLRKLYYEALEIEGVVGIAIATRPDCLDDDILDLLLELNNRTYLWIELGLQTIHEKTSNFIRRGYNLETYDDAIKQLKQRNIRVVTHMIVGLPFESKEDILMTAKHIAKTNTWGIKIHSLYIQKHTDLYEYYLKNPFSIFTKEEYINLVVEILGNLPKDMVIHRLTGDGKKDLLHEPKWSCDKLNILSNIDKQLKTIDSYQGKKYLLT